MRSNYAPPSDHINGYQPDQSFRQEDISKREKEVLYLIAHGYSSKMIADKLCISIHTATTHRTNLLDKFQAKNTAELVLMASRRFWL
jgi:DNA-binding CsgD family transcriptional regulator